MSTFIDSPLSKLSNGLKKTLGNNPRIMRLLSSIDPENLKPSDRAIIEELDQTVTEYIKPSKPNTPNVLWIKEWQRFMKDLYRWLDWGCPSDTKVIAAAILAGAAIALPEITLRKDLAPSLFKARDAFQGSINAGVDPKAPNSLVYSLHPNVITRPLGVGQPSIVTDLADTALTLARGPGVPNHSAQMSPLGLSINPDGMLFGKIRELLQDEAKPIRVSFELKELDVNTLDVLINERFRQGFRARAIRQPHGDEDKQVRDSYAPTSATLKLLDTECVKCQEEASDEVFWVSRLYTLRDLQGVYDALDTAIKNDALGEVTLNLEWDIRAAKTALLHMSDGDEKSLNLGLGEIDIYHGFSPWTASLICVEDDDAEYDAISETIDTVDDCAKVIAQASSTVAAVSGPSPVGLAAAAVASVANYVVLACQVTGAIVDIVNFFDSDDVIGFADITGRGEYAQDHPYRTHMGGQVKNIEEMTVAGGRRGGVYKIRSEESWGQDEKFQRVWRYRQEKAKGAWLHKDPFGCHGGKGDIKVTIPLSYQADMVLPSDVDHHPDHPSAHAEWVDGPHLQPNRMSCKGKVHWGVRACNEIDFQPWAMVGSFQKLKEEEFLIQ